MTIPPTRWDKGHQTQWHLPWRRLEGGTRLRQRRCDKHCQEGREGETQRGSIPSDRRRPPPRQRHSCRRCPRWNPSPAPPSWGAWACPPRNAAAGRDAVDNDPRQSTREENTTTTIPPTRWDKGRQTAAASSSAMFRRRRQIEATMMQGALSGGPRGRDLTGTMASFSARIIFTLSN
jgi:hypothetical protein